MKKRILIGLIVLLLLLGATVAWDIHRVGQPIRLDEIPLWRVTETEAGHWLLQSIEEPQRKTNAWIEGPVNRHLCDTFIMVAGIKEGKEFLLLDGSISETGHSVLMQQPIRNFARPETFKQWGLLEWWNFPSRVRWEFVQNIGALKALLDHISMLAKTESSPFSGRVVLVGGSLGAPIPVILTSFYPEEVAGLMIIFAFTNFSTLFENEIYRQGLIHFRIPENDNETISFLKRTALEITAEILSIFLGNMLKYGQIELYLKNIHNTPIHFINGKRDYLINEETYRSMWKASPEPKTEFWLEGDHIDPGNPQEVKNIIRLIDDWTKSQNLRECEN